MDMEREIANQFKRWNDALQSGDPARVVSLYAPKAVLLPTLSNRVRTTPAQIKNYFFHFLKLAPRGKIVRSHIRIFGGLAIRSGLYTFCFSSGDVVQARFTFVYQWTAGQWLIVEHHSSAMPEGQPAKAPASKASTRRGQHR